MVSKRRTSRRGLALLGLTMVAVLAFGAVTAGAALAAYAPRWKAGGSYLGASGTKSFTATSTSEVKLSTAWATFKSPSGECSESGEIQGSNIGSPGTEKNIVLSCKKVTIENAPNCIVHSTGAEAGTVTTNSLKSTLVWLGESGNAAGNMLEATSGTTMTTIEFSNKSATETCSLEGTLPLQNAVIDEFLPVGKESVTGELNFPGTTITSYYDSNRAKQTITRLKLAGSNATLTGKFAFSLNSKEAVGVSPTPELRWGIFEGGAWNPLNSGSQRAFTASNTSPLHFSVGAVKLEFPECTETGQITGGVPGGEKEVILTCHGAAVEGAPTCDVHSPGQKAGTIVANRLKGTLVQGAPEGVLLQAEEAGQSLFTIEIPGSCGASIYNGPITGSLTAKLDEGEGTVNTFYLEGAALKRGASNASLTSAPFNYSVTGKTPFRAG